MTTIEYREYQEELQCYVNILKEMIPRTGGRINIIEECRLYKCGEIYEYFVHMNVGAQVMNISLCGIRVLIFSLDNGIYSSTKLWKILRPFCVRNTEKRKQRLIKALLDLNGKMSIDRLLSDSSIDKYRKMREIDLIRECIDRDEDGKDIDLADVIQNDELYSIIRFSEKPF